MFNMVIQGKDCSVVRVGYILKGDAVQRKTHRKLGTDLCTNGLGHDESVQGRVLGTFNSIGTIYWSSEKAN